MPARADGSVNLARSPEAGNGGRSWIRTSVGRSPADLQSALVGHLSILPDGGAEARDSTSAPQAYFATESSRERRQVPQASRGPDRVEFLQTPLRRAPRALPHRTPPPRARAHLLARRPTRRSGRRNLAPPQRRPRSRPLPARVRRCHARGPRLAGTALARTDGFAIRSSSPLPRGTRPTARGGPHLSVHAFAARRARGGRSPPRGGR